MFGQIKVSLLFLLIKYFTYLHNFFKVHKCLPSVLSDSLKTTSIVSQNFIDKSWSLLSTYLRVKYVFLVPDSNFWGLWGKVKPSHICQNSFQYLIISQDFLSHNSFVLSTLRMFPQSRYCNRCFFDITQYNTLSKYSSQNRNNWKVDIKLKILNPRAIWENLFKLFSKYSS